MVITLAFQANDAGSIPAIRSIHNKNTNYNFKYADIAQLVEYTFGKGEVGSSILPISIIN